MKKSPVKSFFVFFLLCLCTFIASANSIIGTTNVLHTALLDNDPITAVRLSFGDVDNNLTTGIEPTYWLFDLTTPLVFDTPYILDSGTEFDIVTPLMADGLNDNIYFLAGNTTPPAIESGFGWIESLLFYNSPSPVFGAPPSSGVDFLGYTITSLELILHQRVNDINIDATLNVRGFSTIPLPPALDIEKLTNGNQADSANDSDVPRILPGETVSWIYLVTNTGEIDVSEAEITVTDSQPGITPVLDTASDGGSDSILSAGETWTYTASAQALDLETPPEGVTVVPGCNDDRNTYQNIGRVEIVGSDVSDEDLSHYCNYGRTEINIRKQAEGPDSRTFVSGSDVTFEIEVTNTGEVDLDNVIVTDEIAPDCSNDIGFLGIGLTETYECTVSSVTSSLENEACVSGESSEGVQVEKCDSSSVEIIGIDIRKQEEGADTRNFLYASDVSFEIFVTNTSGEDLANVSVSDPEVPACDNDIGDLAAGDSVSYTCTQLSVTLGFTNEACVSADRNGVTVEDCDPSTVVIGVPALESSINKLDIKYKGKNLQKGDVNLKANVALDNLPDDSDVITVMVDGIELFSAPFSELKGSHSFKYKSKNIKVKLNLKKGVLDVKRKKIGLTGIDNSDGVDVEIYIGDAVNVENVVMMQKGKKSLKYKRPK